jgi:Uma2 family endonuclease
MSLATEAPIRFRTVADLLVRLGDIPPERIRLHPAPGSATERDLLQPSGRLCELVDGILVEKAMGYDESLLKVELLLTLAAFVKRNRLGEVTGPDGTFRLMPGLVRIPDIAFTSRARLPRKSDPRRPIPRLVPDLAIEVLSKSNTKKEMKRKLEEYFEAGVRLVWMIDPKTRTALVYHSPKTPTKLVKSESLDGEDILPGFTQSLEELFECLDRGRDD